jgi:hypothetical protein
MIRVEAFDTNRRTSGILKLKFVRGSMSITTLIRKEQCIPLQIA